MVEKNGQISIEWKFKNDSGFDFLRNESVCVRMEDEKERDTIFITFSKREGKCLSMLLRRSACDGGISIFTYESLVNAMITAYGTLRKIFAEDCGRGMLPVVEMWNEG